MNKISENITELVEMLPDSEQRLAYEFIKRLVLAWDPDFTKMTASEKKSFDIALKGEYIRLDDIDWNDKAN